MLSCVLKDILCTSDDVDFGEQWQVPGAHTCTPLVSRMEMIVDWSSCMIGDSTQISRSRIGAAGSTAIIPIRFDR